MHPTRLPVDEPRRLASLDALGILDTAPEPGFDVLVETTAQLTACPVAALCLIDADRQWIKAAHGMPRTAQPRWQSFCTHTILGDGPMEVADASCDPRFASHPAVSDAPHLRLYAGVPLQVDGANVGSLFVMRAAPGPLAEPQREALQRMAVLATTMLAGRPRLRSLEHERTRLLDFARASGDWMWETDDALRYTWVSGAFEAVTGIAANDMLGRTIADGPLLDPFGEPLAEGATLHQLLHARQHVTRVLTPKATDRGVLHISRSAVPAYDGHGRFCGYRGTARDVSARVSTERGAHVQAELLRKLSSQVPGVIFQLLLRPDRSLHYLYASDACREMYGAEPPRDGDGGDGAAVCRAIHPDDRDPTRDRLFAAAAANTPWHCEFRTLRGGQVRWLALRAQPDPQADGSVLWHGFVDDVTERKEIEQLQREKETAERASRAKSEFLSRVSHELRTPLNGILGFAQVMALDGAHPLSADQARRLESVQHAGRHLLELINDMLDLARIEQGGATMQRTPIELAAAVQRCIALVQPLAERAGVRVIAPAPLPHWSRADGRAVEQVLINLLSNAIKYNRSGGRVEVTLRAAPGSVNLSVRDEGDGLTESQQAHLFEPFNRLGAEQRRVEGTGLGLVIARALAQAMGGQLRLQSTPGLGSTFTLSLPAADEPAGAAPPDARPAATPDHGLSTSPTPRSVLYIEDEPLNQLLMQEVFRTQPQWTLHVAADGASGLAHLADARPDLVLIDMNLPDTNGLDLIRRIRTHPARSDLHCIALSADAMQPQIDAALAAGYNAYWTKPIHVPEVLARLARLLG